MKKSLSILLSLLMAFSAFSVMPFSAFADTYKGIELDEAKFYFDTSTTGWTLGTTDKIAFYITSDKYGEEMPYGAKKLCGTLCEFGSEEGVWEYDPAAKGITIEDGVQYKIQFYNTGDPELTYPLYFDSNCLGHVAVCDGTEYDNPTDSSKTMLVAFWNDLDSSVYGPMLAITSSGSVVGTCVKDNETKLDMFENFISVAGDTGATGLENARVYVVEPGTKTEQQLIDDLGTALGLTKQDVYDAFNENSVETTWDYTISTLPGDVEIALKCGDSVYYYYTDNGATLTLFGTGDTWDYTCDFNADPICDSPFWKNRDIKTINVESGVTGLGDYLFYCCYDVESISLPEGLTKIGECGFNFFEKAENITIPSSVTSIGVGAFANWQKLKSITIPDGVTSIELDTFVYCYDLESVVIPKSVTSVGDNAFSNCKSLTDVYYYGSEADRSNMTISSTYNSRFTGATWHYNCRSGKCGDNVSYFFDGETLTLSGTGATWDYNWSDNKSPFFNNDTIETITVGDGITRIGDVVFSDCEKLKPFTLPDSVTSLGDNAFGNCYALDNLTLPDSITEIGELCFTHCDGLESITLPAKLEKIGNGAFYYCEKLSDITIPEMVTEIGSTAFGYCSALQSVSIPKGVTVIGVAPFFASENLTAITVDKDNPNYCDVDGVLFNKDKTVLIQYPIGKTATNYTIPSSVSTIGQSSFVGQQNIKELVMPKTVSKIEKMAFWNCVSLSDVYYGGTKSEWQTLLTNTGSDNGYLTGATIHYTETVSFNANGGTGNMEPYTDYTEFTYALPACEFLKDGRTFYKWQIGDELKAPEETIAVNDSVEVKALWKYTNPVDYDATVDESSTDVVGTLYITDTRTGVAYDYNVQSSKSVDSSYDNAKNADVDVLIEEVNGYLDDAVKIFAGNYEVTEVSYTIADPTVKYSHDYRTETKYYGYDENLPSGLAATDANGDYCYYNYKDGNYYKKWRCAITYVVEYTSLQPVVKLDGWTYGAPANEPTVENNNGDGRVEYFYKAKDADDSEYSKDSPTKPGEYTVKAEIAAGGIYEAETVTADFTIAPAEVTITADNQKSYRGSALKDLTYKLTGGYVDGDDLGIKIETAANKDVAGEYDITVTAANANYTITLVNGKYTVKDKILDSEKAEAEEAINAEAKGESSAKAVTIYWGKAKKVDKIVVYAAYCGKNHRGKYKKIATLKGNATKYEITKLNVKKLNQKKNVKAYVVAYRKVNGKYRKIAKSIHLHVAGFKSKRTNTKAIKLKKSKFTLKKGKTAKIKGSIVLEDSSKKAVNHVRKLRFKSSNKKVATVSRSGKIKAKGKGNCTIYVFANNGKAKKVKVTVK